MLGAAAGEVEGVTLYHGEGCGECATTGYRGRKGIFEMFTIDDEIRDMIFNRTTASELRNRARELGMRTLREDGLRKAVAGITTLEEVFRVTMGDEN